MEKYNNYLKIMPKNNINPFNIKNGIGISANTLSRISYEEIQRITPETIFEYALRLVETIRQENPQFILVCDRNAPLIGSAVHIIYDELYRKLPTINGCILYRKLTSKQRFESENALEKLARQLIQQAARQGILTPKVIIIDDWVASGSTKKLIVDSLRRFSDNLIHPIFITTIGNSDPTLFEWDSNEHLIGISYPTLDKPQSVMTQTSREYRKRIAKQCQLKAKIRKC